MEQYLILHIPVIHKGYVDFLKDASTKVSRIFLLDQSFLEELTEMKPDIASLDFETANKFLVSLGFSNISPLTKDCLAEINGKNLLFVQDEISRKLYTKYFQGQPVEWSNIFLRWDREKVFAENPIEGIKISSDSFDLSMMEEAQKEAQKSSDWWRQVGAILVREKEIIARGYNQGILSDHTPYQVGAVRDFLKPGERPDLTNYIHAEQKIIAEAAKEGISLRGTSLYITHFPCAVCAKLIAYSGISTVFFHEGSSTLDGKEILEAVHIQIVRVK